MELNHDWINSDLGNSYAREKNLKEYEYLNYLKNHINKVKEAYYNKFVPLLSDDTEARIILKTITVNEFKEAIRNAENNIIKHDESKYYDEEFNHYRIRFYPTIEEKEWLKANYGNNEDEFVEEAWRHHYKNNPHHPKYWVNEETGEINDMPLKFIIEMLCDWMSFGDNTKDFYYNKAVDEKASMSTRTKEIVEQILDILY